MLFQCLYYQYIYPKRIYINSNGSEGEGDQVGASKTPLLLPDNNNSTEVGERDALLLGTLLILPAMAMMNSNSDSPTTGMISTDKLIPYILGYISAGLFMCSRIPQIILNFRKKSCEGLSLTLFILGVAGNITYSISVFFHSTEVKYLLEMAPWLLGCLGTIFLDMIIFTQFYMYRKHRPSLAASDFTRLEKEDPEADPLIVEE